LVRFNIKFSTRKNSEELQAKRQRLVTTMPDLMRACGHQIAISLAVATTPYGTSNGARQLGEKAVTGDINRVYVSPSKVFKSFPNTRQGDAFWAAMQKRGYVKAQQIVNAYHPIYRGIPIRPFDGGAAHKAARVNGKIRKNQKPVMILQTERNLAAYLKQEIYHVGEAKAGWAACAKLLGTMRGLPQWVTRHAGNLSGGTKIESFNGPRLTLTLRNEVPYAAAALSPGEKQVAINIGLQRFLKGQLAAILNGTAKSSE
jgi:hypothetical protein